jgi:hypothetical protein
MEFSGFSSVHKIKLGWIVLLVCEASTRLHCPYPVAVLQPLAAAQCCNRLHSGFYCILYMAQRLRSFVSHVCRAAKGYNFCHNLFPRFCSRLQCSAAARWS